MLWKPLETKTRQKSNAARVFAQAAATRDLRAVRWSVVVAVWTREEAGSKYSRWACPSWVRDDLNKYPVAKERQNSSFGRFCALPSPPPNPGCHLGGKASAASGFFPTHLPRPSSVQKTLRKSSFELFYGCGRQRRKPSAVPAGDLRQSHVGCTIARQSPTVFRRLPLGSEKTCQNTSFGRFCSQPRRPRAAKTAHHWEFPGPPNICSWRYR